MNEVLTCHCGNQSQWDISGWKITCRKCGLVYSFLEFVDTRTNLTPTQKGNPRDYNPLYRGIYNKKKGVPK